MALFVGMVSHGATLKWQRGHKGVDGMFDPEEHDHVTAEDLCACAKVSIASRVDLLPK